MRPACPNSIVVMAVGVADGSPRASVSLGKNVCSAVVENSTAESIAEPKTSACDSKVEALAMMELQKLVSNLDAAREEVKTANEQIVELRRLLHEVYAQAI